METDLNKLAIKIKPLFHWIDYIIIENGDTLIIEQDYEMGDGEDNDNECCDEARENGQMIVKEFPQLEVKNYYCHRHKYATIELKLIK